MSRRKRRAQSTKNDSPVSASFPSWMNGWERYWFGSVAAIRPYLLIKGVLLLLAFDLWLLRIPGGSRYGLDGFNVAHFQWLDAIQPLPGPDLYVGVLLLTGWLALVCALTSAGRWLLALLALLYTYTWGMSMLDGFQHHYFLSLVLTAFVFFPRLRADDLYPHGAVTAKSKKETDSLDTGNKRVSSWGYVLLGVNVATIYAFTALTKASEPAFFTGQMFQRLTTKENFFVPIEAWFTGLGGSRELFWELLAMSVIALEMFLAMVYLLAVRQDDIRSRRMRLLTGSALAMAVAFHGIGNELILSLRIGWFSYYMIVLACVYLLPESFLWVVGRVLTWPTRWAGETISALSGTARLRSDRVASVLTFLGAIAMAGIVGVAHFWLDLPGVTMSGGLTAAFLLTGTLTCLLLGRQPDAMRYVLACGLAGLLMWSAITQSTVRFDFYDRFGLYNQSRGNVDTAIEAYEKALRYVPAWKRKNLDLKAAK